MDSWDGGAVGGTPRAFSIALSGEGAGVGGVGGVGAVGEAVFASSAAGGRLSGVVAAGGGGGAVSRRWRDSRRAASETEIGGLSFAGGDTPGSEEGAVGAALGAGAEAGVEEGVGAEGVEVDSDMIIALLV